MVQANEEAIRAVVQEVLANLGRTPAQSAYGEPANSYTNGHSGENWGVFNTVNEAVAAANAGFEALANETMETRAKAIECVRSICVEQADELGRLEMEETQVGKLEHKIDKLHSIQNIPGIEFLKTDSVSGDHGLTMTEYAPFGVIGAITPVTHSLPTIACNFINMVSAGNTIVVNPHPSGKNIACEGVKRFNKAIFEATGLKNLLTIIGNPTIESADEIFNHRGVRLLCVTGGPMVARAALASSKRAIVAGPGNPPVLVDETADLENAASSIVKGCAYDNNLLCIAEKEVFAVDSIFDQLMDAVGRNGGYLLTPQETERLTALAFSPPDKPGGHMMLNRELVGKDPSVLGEKIGVPIPAGTEILYAETDDSNPFVFEEQMMPFLPFIRCRDANHGIELAKKHEHGYGHTAILHSRNVRVMSTMGRVMNTTLFIINGACMAGLGGGGEGYPSYSIATPTGEGVTNPLTFTRQRRCTLVDDLRII